MGRRGSRLGSFILNKLYLPLTDLGLQGSLPGWFRFPDDIDLTITVPTLQNPGGSRLAQGSPDGSAWVAQRGGTIPAYGPFGVTAASQQIRPFNQSRTGITIYNAGNAPIFLGSNANVTTANGFAIPAGGSFSTYTEAALYVIAAANQQAYYWEDSY